MSIVFERNFNSHEWKELLDEFAALVKKGKYEKIDYSDWKRIYKLWPISLGIQTITGVITINGNYDFRVCKCKFDDDWDPVEDKFYYSGNDHSLGQFIKESYISVEEEKETLQTSKESIDNKTLQVDPGGVQYYYSPHTHDLTAVKTSFNSPVSVGSIDDLENEICDQRDTLAEMKEAIDKLQEERKDKDMKSVNFNFDFGWCGNSVRMSMYGPAIKNAEGTWVAYDAKADAVVDVDIFNFKGDKFMMKVPVAVKDISKGDMVIHKRQPVFVTDVSDGIKVVDIYAGEKKEIMPVTNMFGFNFVTKVVCLFDGLMSGMSADTPFGNMLPLFLMQDSCEDNTGLMMAMMMQNQNGFYFQNNPMMMYLMMSDNCDSDMLLPMMMMMNQPKAEHQCSCASRSTDSQSE